MEDTFSQIEGAAQHSIPNVNVAITPSGSIVGQGVTTSANAISMCGGKINDILQAFGGIEGGDTSFGGKNVSVVRKAHTYGGKLASELDDKLQEVYDQASDLEAFAALGQSALSSVADEQEVKSVLEKIISHIDAASRSIRTSVEQEAEINKQSASDFLERNETFIRAIKTLGAQVNDASKAGMLSLSFSSVNDLSKLAKDISFALKSVDMKKSEYLGSSLADLDRELTEKLTSKSKSMSTEEMKKFLHAWSTLIHHHGHKSAVQEMIGGYSKTNNLSERLLASRNELRSMINQFIDAFGININGIASSATSMAAEFGKGIVYDDNTILFLESFKRINEYLAGNRSKLYQHLLELNVDQIDSKEIKDRFLSSIRDLADRTASLHATSATKEFAQYCLNVISTVNKYGDMIKTHRDAVKKEGGSQDSTNELFSIDSSKIDITGLLNPLENLSIAIKKIEFFRNIAVFRSNLNQTSKELSIYSKDYTKSVGQAIGEAITKIQNEYTDIINQISDNKTGMGLEIDMYNDSLPHDQKISKEKLKTIYKWQCDARIGLYKTVEAIDLYLLHFTQSVVKNPDAVADLHKLLSATRVIAKWYDNTAGDNLIRAFESFGEKTDSDLDVANFSTAGYGTDGYANLEQTVGGEKAMRIYERCRRAVQGVVVLKNIISYFITISEKYGNFKSEQNIYMAPSNIYKNLTNYLWASSLDVNTVGTEILNDNNETKRMLTYEDTKVKLAQISTIDPETFGINFNKHSIDKLRILKCHNELTRLKGFISSVDGEDIKKIKQYVTSVFARLGKTKYIFEMFLFGVYDLTVMENDMLRDFFNYINAKLQVTAAGRTITITLGERVYNLKSKPDVDALVDTLQRLPKEARNTIEMKCSAQGASVYNLALNLKQFQAIDAQDLGRMIGMSGRTDYVAREPENEPRPVGIFKGFLFGLMGNEDYQNNAALTTRVVHALQHVVVNMMNQYKREHNSSYFAIDDTYFILTVKAIAGKVMTVTGINKMFKNPTAYNNTILSNQTRLIMGGASSDGEVIEDAIELYVRIPLLVEFYRRIFEDGNQKYKREELSERPDEETIAFVPEIGSIWSGLITNIFDKSRHIANGVYTMDNIKKIISEVNTIYKHYKGSVDKDSLTRHIMMELVAEINRRYSIIKREELTRYYRVVNTTTRNRIEIGESNYTNNDLDILNEAMEFEEKSPSDEFIKLKSTMSDPTVSIETKINKLTDYKILKDFRQRIENAMRVGEGIVGADVATLSMVERIRMLKKAIQRKQSQEDKYDMIIKAIEEAEGMTQSSNDIYTCFHEFVVMPLRTAYQMYYALDNFIHLIYTLIATDLPDNDQFLKSSHGKDSRTIEQLLISLALSNDNPIKRNSGQLIIGTKLSNAYVHEKDALPVLTKKDTIPAAGAADRAAADIIVNECKLSLLPTLLMRTLIQFATNSGDLVKIKLATTNSLTMDFSEYQKVCEHLIANVKFMIDKFTGLVPQSLVQKVTSVEIGGVQNTGSIYLLEQNLLNGIFNKLNKKEKERSVVSVDTLNSLMPAISSILFTNKHQFGLLTETLMLQNYANLNIVQNVDYLDNMIEISKCMPVIRDSFKLFRSGGRVFSLDKSDEGIFVSTHLFNPRTSASINDRGNVYYGVVQEFNQLVACYLNDLYDHQSSKMYTKSFANFASSALLNALNGQSIPDFARTALIKDTNNNDVTDVNYRDKKMYHLPRSQIVLSSTLAFVMRTMMNRIHPTTGANVHNIANIDDMSPHIKERYRSIIPMYHRIFKGFLARCQLYRKFTSRMQGVNAGYIEVRRPEGSLDTDLNIPAILRPQQFNPRICQVKESGDDTSSMYRFSNIDPQNDNIFSIDNSSDMKDTICLHLDEIVNAMSSLVQDVEIVQKELLETDTSVSLYFDIKKDFTKNYYMHNKQLPFAPISILAMGFVNRNANGQAIPLYNVSDSINNKYLYGMRSLLINDFKISSENIPYLKKLVGDFNGYTVNSNNISEKKFNDVLNYVGKATNFIYDARFYNGGVYMQSDILGSRTLSNIDLLTFQESKPKINALGLIENVNLDESRNRIAEYVKEGHGIAPVEAERRDPSDMNVRRRAIMVNILDMNIMPINIHSLMREIPLANLYNYAMTFDFVVESLETDRLIDKSTKQIIKNPYIQIDVTDAGIAIGADAVGDIRTLLGNSDTRFIDDQLIDKLLRYPKEGDGAITRPSNDERKLRLNSKLVRNLLFLTLVQRAIKIKVKRELDFINTRIVENTASVNNVITDLQTNGVAVNDQLFDF